MSSVTTHSVNKNADWDSFFFPFELCWRGSRVLHVAADHFFLLHCKAHELFRISFLLSTGHRVFLNHVGCRTRDFNCFLFAKLRFLKFWSLAEGNERMDKHV